MLKCALAGVFAALWLLDTATTILFIGVGGVELELNPILRALMVNHGLVAFAFFKAATLAFLLIFTQRIWTWVWCALIAIMIPVVWIGTLLAGT